MWFSVLAQQFLGSILLGVFWSENRHRCSWNTKNWFAIRKGLAAVSLKNEFLQCESTGREMCVCACIPQHFKQASADAHPANCILCIHTPSPHTWCNRYCKHFLSAPCGGNGSRSLVNETFFFSVCVSEDRKERRQAAFTCKWGYIPFVCVCAGSSSSSLALVRLTDVHTGSQLRSAGHRGLQSLHGKLKIH